MRKRAEQALQQMQPAQLMRAAVTCDYSSECLGFLRSNFDIDDPDPATIFRAFQTFQERMTVLFVDGYILGNSPQSTVQSPSDISHNAKTACQMVFEEIQNPEPILVGR